MSIYTNIISKAIFPAQEKFKKHTTVDVRRRLEESQWSSLDDIKNIQFDNLKRFLVEVNNCVPYYRELFKKLDFLPESITSVSDVAKLPFLDKSTIRKNTEDLKSITSSGLSKFNTGGSSGEPLIFYLGRERVSHDVAAKWRATRWWGVDIGDPEVVIWGSPIELKSQDHLKIWRDKVFRSELLSAFDLTPDSLARFIHRIRTIRPKMLFGYPSVISMIANYANSQSIKLDDLGIKVVFVTSECLYDHQRSLIEATLGCPVANGYGGRDAGFLAHQCPEGSLHISAEDILVEIVSPNGDVLEPGQVGEIVVTHTATSEFPFIRYRTGDMGCVSEEPCRCGRGLPVLDKLLGRSTDFILAQDGTMLHGLSLIYVLRDIQGIDFFKIVQESRDKTKIQLVVSDQYSVNDEAVIKSQFQQRLGEKALIEFDYCQVIPAEKSGKYRYVVSYAN